MEKKALKISLVAVVFAALLLLTLYHSVPLFGEVESSHEECLEKVFYEDLELCIDNGGGFYPRTVSLFAKDNEGNAVKYLNDWAYEVAHTTNEEKVEKWKRTVTYRWLFLSKTNEEIFHKIYLKER